MPLRSRRARPDQEPENEVWTDLRERELVPEATTVLEYPEGKARVHMAHQSQDSEQQHLKGPKDLQADLEAEQVTDLKSKREDPKMKMLLHQVTARKIQQ